MSGREWTKAEDAEVFADIPLQQIAERLGRSYTAVKSRRQTLRGTASLKMPAKPAYLPRFKAASALIAKTCRGCGDLKMAHDYGLQGTGTSHKSKCKSCCNQEFRDRRAANNHLNDLSKQSDRDMQSTTLPSAKNHCKEWTGPELELVARKDLSAREVAQMIGRTLYAVRNQRSARAGHKWKVLI